MTQGIKEDTSQIKRLACYYQDYAWGKTGESSMVYELLEHDIKANTDHNSKFAELWMGTHPNLPSTVRNSPDNKSLKDYILSAPDALLGKAIRLNHGDDLPFLFKVLSVGKALSIQAHPDKNLAKKLHSSWPDLYKDGNHKPEMAIALTQFEALCGFRPLTEILGFMKALPEFKELLERNGDTTDFEAGSDRLYVQRLFHNLMSSPEDQVKKLLTQVFHRLESDSSILDQDIYELVLRLHEQYPGDVGIFCAFMLNFVVLSPGQAIFLGANEPHAYLSGDCIECMATSDNVVRAGLTPKFKDVKVLTNMLTYNSDPIVEKILNGTPIAENPYSLLYDPPISEFSVVSVKITGAGLYEEYKKINGPGILLITDAPSSAKLVSGVESFPLFKGNVFFVPPNIPFVLSFGEAQCDSFLEAFFAYCSEQ